MPDSPFVVAKEREAMTTAEKLASSVWGVILARFISPALLSIAIALGVFIANGIFTRMDQMTAAQSALADQLQTQSIRITAIEAKNEVVSKMQSDDFSELRGALTDVMQEMTALRNKLDGTTNQVSGLTAKVDILLTRLGGLNMVPDDRRVQ